jgi:pre-mRNA cleavage complex 2 protein Pcf11
MVAEDHADSLSSARAVYGVIRKRLLSTSASNMLPLVYVIDSILKNVKGRYVEIIGSDAEQWLPVVHRHLPELQKQKLHKVYNTWVDLRLFPADRLEAMGRCFDQSASATATSSQPTAGGPPGAPAPLAGGLRTVGGGIRRAVRVLAAFIS